MFLFRILLLFLIFINVIVLYASEDTIKNIRFSDNYQNKSLRIVLDLTHKTAYKVFTLNNKRIN